MKQINPISDDVAVRIFKLDSDKYKLLTEEGQFTIINDLCSCGHERDFTPSMTAGFEQSYINRRNESCVHQEAVLNAVDIGSCSACRNRVVEKNEMHHNSRHVITNISALVVEIK